MIEEDLRQLTASINALTAAINGMVTPANTMTRALKSDPAHYVIDVQPEPAQPEPVAEAPKQVAETPKPEPVEEVTKPVAETPKPVEVPKAEAPAPSGYTEDSLKDLLKKVFQVKGGSAVSETIQSFGGNRLGDLDPAKYDELGQALETLLGA